MAVFFDQYFFKMSLEKIVSETHIRHLVENDNKTHKQIGAWLNERFPGSRGISERSVRRYCAKHNINSRDSISTDALKQVVSSAVREVRLTFEKDMLHLSIVCYINKPTSFKKVGPTYGRKLMSGYLRHSRNIKVGVNRVGRLLKDVNPHYHNERISRAQHHFNPLPYYAEYFGHKLHLDQNEKLIRYGVTEVIAVDGFSSFITAKSVMALKNNIIIYEQVFRLVLTTVYRVVFI